MKLEIKYGNVFIDGKETKDAQEIGNAVLTHFREAEQQIRPAIDDYHRLTAMIDNEKDRALLNDWLHRNRIDCCFPRNQNETFQTNYWSTRLLVDLVTMINNGELILSEKETV